MKHLLLLALIVLAPVTQSQQSQPSPAQQALLAERRALVPQADAARAKGDFAAAVGFAERVLAIDRSLFGEIDETVADSLDFLASVHEEAGQFEAAERRAVEAFAVLSKVLAPGDWRLTDARLRVAHLRRRLSLSAADNALLQQVNERHRTAYELGAKGKYREAIAITEENLRLRTRLLGPSDNATLSTINNLAFLLSRLGEYQRARELYEQALAARLKDLGEEHPATARSRNNLGELLAQTGDYRRAEELFLRAFMTVKELLGEEAPETISILNNIGFLYNQMGDVALAEQTHRLSLSLRKKTYGDRHPSTALGLLNLATVYAEMGDPARAQSLYEEALSIYREKLGAEHPETASVMNSLASMWHQLDEIDRAESLFKEALAIQQRVFGEDDLHVAITLNNLALLYLDTGAAERAAPLFEQAIAIRRRRFGDRHPGVASSLNNAAKGYIRLKDYARAGELLQEALSIQREVLPARHPDLARTLHGLGTLSFVAGNHAQAEPLIREALEIALWNIDLASAAQSERQLLLATSIARDHLESYLTLARHGAVPPATAWSRTMGWKGRAMARQRAARTARKDPDTNELFNALQSAASELSQLALREPEPAAVETTTRRIAELTDRKEQLERRLAQAASSMRVGPATAESVRSSIPADAVLLDCFESVDRFIVFIVRREGEIEQLTLGSSVEIAEALERWHVLTKSGVDPTGVAKRLRDLVWTPIEARLRDRELALISPEGMLGSLAFGALPGRAPGRFLIEERAIVMLPAPGMLPDLIAAAPSRGISGGVLALGNVDYGQGQPAGRRDAPSSSMRAPREAGAAFAPLPGTSGEIAAIEKILRAESAASSLTTLSGADATEGAVRAQLSSHVYLHLATHGFFASRQFRSALMRGGSQSEVTNIAQTIAGYNPDLLSGLVFAGANNPTAEDDGILTAAEVASMDLSAVRLAVLSACETGLGLAAGGEGLLGLQRAFQTAGAGAVIATMWNVDDDATQMLMERFYQNLWTKKMGTLDALRDAQLWMLRSGRKHPFFWGAFVLSGDWR